MDQLIAEDPTRIGPYRLVARLGAGGMGLVYLGRSEVGRTVAVKVVQAEYAQHPEFRRRFAREVAAARRVGGTWTADVLDADTDADVPWVATQYIPGPDLTTVVTEDYGPLPETSVRTLAHRLATALQSVHGAGLIHRDLKPSNVLVTVDGPRVIDFGIARAMDTLVGDSLHTRTGMLIGSPGFMSPEQVRGLDLTPASDVFCLGAVLVYAATGRLLFGATETGLSAHLFRIAEDEPDLTGVPDSLVDLVRECLHKDPARRPTPADVAARTAADLDGEWLPGQVLAQLGRRAAELLDFAPETRTDRDAAPSVPAQAAPVPAPVDAPPVPTPVDAPPVPAQPAYTPTAHAVHSPPPGFGPPVGYAQQPGMPPAPPLGAAPHPKRWLGLGVAVLAHLLVVIGAAVTTASLPSLGADLALASDHLRTVLTGYAVAFGALLLLGGHLADLVGRRKTMVVGLVGLALSGAISGLAASAGFLLASQIVQGASAALISTAGLAFVSSAFTTPKERGTAFGAYGAVVAGGTALGLFAGGALLEALGWRACLYALGALAVLAAVGAATLMPDQPVRTPARLDAPGLLLGSAALGALVLGFRQAQGEEFEQGWTDPLTLVFLGLGVVLLIVFVAVPVNTTGGLLPGYVLRDRNRAGALLALLLGGVGTFAVWLYLPRFLPSVYGYSPSGTGLALLPLAAAAAVTALLVAARLQHRLAPRELIVPGLSAAAVGLALLTGLSADGAYVTEVLPGLVLVGAGLGLAFVPLLATATGGTAPQDSGGTSAAVHAAQQLGGLIAIPAFGTILAPGLRARLAEADLDPAVAQSAAKAGVPLDTGQLPAALAEGVGRANQAILSSYSVVFWWAAGLVLLAALLAGGLVNARATERAPRL